MGNEHYDVAVVGGGPAGAVAAATAARHGATVLLVEKAIPEHKPVQCTGLVSLRTLEEAGIDSDADVVLREITGASVYAPNGRRLQLGGGRTRAVVIDRQRFDLLLLERARLAGVDVRTETTAVGLEGAGLRLNHNGRESVVRAKVIIGADGPRSRIAQWKGLPEPQELLVGFQTVAPYEPEREDAVSVFLGSALAPRFFAWAVPERPGWARIGLGTDPGRNAHRHLDDLLRKLGITKPQGLTAGLIPIGPPPRTVADGVLLVGDAAGQAKPTSGGGLYTGIVCAKIAGEVAADCARRGDAEAAALAAYEERWRKLLGKELAFGMLAHRLLASLSDASLNEIVAFLDDPEILTLINEYGDIDSPSILARRVLQSPKLWRKAVALVPQAMMLRDLLHSSRREKSSPKMDLRS
ncbi:MAG: geranylgeranyl reductase family protein [Candidatus Acetothermia bacterium]|jgi:geranylgeranyl reductase family protein|nr:geranylgeranyl reductase family protein [Candidatus Acetothermia bacterium]MDH7504579.1 geranylgeranyl reductase family protein [Candidatus Acetothermia bacterium]